MKQRKYSWPDGHWDWYQHLAFKHGIRVGDLMFVGGQVDKTDQGEPLHPYDLERQTAAVVGHIDTVLHGLGSGLKDVTKLVAFYASDGSIDEQIFLEHVGLCIIEHSKDTLRDRGPAITTVPLPCLALPGMMVEIEAVAMAQEPTTDRVTTNPEGLTLLPAPFCHGIRCGTHTWVSAQPARRHSESSDQATDICEQTAAMMSRIENVLLDLDADLGDIVRTGCWYRGDGTRSSWENQAVERGKFFPDNAPTTTELPTLSLPAGEFARVDAWAMRGLDGQRLERQAYHSERWDWPLPLPYPAAIRCQDLVFLSAHLPMGPSGEVLSQQGLNEQTRTVMDNTGHTLAAFDLTLNHMVKQTSFFFGRADRNDIVTNQTLRSSFYSEPAGASTGVPMPALAMEDTMVTVDTIAMT
jgi:enamine deaminase RidA (YjgF/YER057c/UK114 family)